MEFELSQALGREAEKESEIARLRKLVEERDATIGALTVANEKLKRELHLAYDEKYIRTLSMM